MSVLKNLIERLQDLPGIGPKSAERIAFWMARRPKEDVKAIADAILETVATLETCTLCGHVAESDPCSYCADTTRDAATICVVETSRDLEALEQTGEFHGRYHVLGGHVAPVEGVALEDLNLSTLMDRVASGDIREVLIATNPTFEGEATASMLKREIGAHDVTITRIARGIPSGGEIVHMNAAVLGEALRSRSNFDA